MGNSARQTISAVIAVKNEEINIKRCLESISWADEIIIIDNQSTDKTVDICKKFTNKIFSSDGGGYNLIPYLQNKGIKKATKDWILVLDADCVVPGKTAVEIKKAIQNKMISAYYLRHPAVFFGKITKSDCWQFPTVKLFRRGSGRYDSSRPHCALITKGRVGRLENPVIHYAHPNLKTFLRKIELYSSQDAELLAKGKKAGLLNKKIRKVNFYNLLIEPLLLSAYYYFKGKGFRDGFVGALTSSLFGYYLFLERKKLRNILKKKRRSIGDENKK